VTPDLVGPYFPVALKEAGVVWCIDWSQPDFPITAVNNVGHILHDGFLSPDNSTFYLAAQTDNWMAAIDVATMEVVEKIPTGEIPFTDGVWTLHPEFTPDGRYVYISDWDGNVVRVYDAVTMELTAEIDGITTPTGIFSVARRLETLGH